MRFHLLVLLFFTFPVVGQVTGTDGLVNRWVLANGEDQWSFEDDGTVMAYYNGMLADYTVLGDTLIIGRSKDDARFRICKLTVGELVLHPLNEAAVKMSDETPTKHAGNTREKIYKNYLAEIAQVKNQSSREAIIAKWKEKEAFYVDTLQFVTREWLYEQVEFDSLYYSAINFVSEKFRFTDMKLFSDGTFIVHKYSSKRTDKERSEIHRVEFLPPLITTNGEGREKEAATEQELLQEKYEAADDGRYQGRVSTETMTELREGIYAIGLSKVKTEPLEELTYYLSLPTSLAHFRICYNGTHSDIETLGMSPQVNMDGFLEAFDWLSTGLVEFEPYTGRPVEFPKPFSVK